MPSIDLSDVGRNHGSPHQAELFGYYEIHLPVTASPSRLCLPLGKPFLVLAWSRPLGAEPEAVQLELDLESPARRGNLVDFLSDSRRAYLNYSLCDLTRKVPELRHASRLLSHMGILYVGDLLLLDPGYLARIVGLSTGEMATLNTLLAEGGLHLDMSIPYWRSPVARIA